MNMYIINEESHGVGANDFQASSSNICFDCWLQFVAVANNAPEVINLMTTFIHGLNIQ